MTGFIVMKARNSYTISMINKERKSPWMEEHGRDWNNGEALPRKCTKYTLPCIPSQEAS
jgi:hypothetical protein